MKERDWIQKYIRPIARSGGAAGLSDDVAILSGDGRSIITMDTLVEGRHFLPTDPAHTVGQKLVRVNVSDILAKGAGPSEAVLSIAWPERYDEAAFAALLDGLAEDLKAWRIDLIGGDTVSTQGPMVLTLTLTGRCFRSGPVRRVGNVAAGDLLWVSGPIGAGAVGLDAAQRNGDPARIAGYRVPGIPTLNHARQVADHGCAAMDISDGLLLDALTLARSNGLGVGIDLARIRLAEPSSDLEQIMAQVTGGDDYQILMVSKPEAQIDDALFYRIGVLTAQPKLLLKLNETRINPPETLGFEH